MQTKKDRPLYSTDCQKVGNDSPCNVVYKSLLKVVKRYGGINSHGETPQHANNVKNNPDCCPVC